VTLLRVDDASNPTDSLFDCISAEERVILNEEGFKRMIAVERKRTERSREPFLLMLLEAGNHQRTEKKGKALDKIISAMLSSTRETDIVGWYKDGTTVGVMFTGLAIDDKNAVLSTILSRVSAALRDELTSDQFSQISLSFHFFPDHWDHENSGRPSNPALYPDLFSTNTEKRSLLIVKRAMDIAGSALLLVLCAPLLLIIAAAVKASSKGPVLFKQYRVGQYGRRFTFLKFRSMRADNDPSVHREYVTKLIAGEAERMPSRADDKGGVYKLANDKRITPIGRFLRKTSLDELPQFLNVIKGDMSLVGPRPPIPYELAAYQTWHRRRVLEVKPGITGLWQVTGRSRVKFDDMVRLDLRYAMSWSPWLDVKILMRTPGAVVKGAH
jgi:lipopolysaccharide/colanic/teichoic acid biosynthesis glycosyltransferase